MLYILVNILMKEQNKGGLLEVPVDLKQRKETILLREKFAPLFVIPQYNKTHIFIFHSSSSSFA